MAATTTARPEGSALRRLDSGPSSSVGTASNSPFDSPQNSRSNSSLSSLDSSDMPTKNTHGVMLDGFGNEFQIPDYTIKDIRDAIPAHCFERSALRGFSYIARDIACLATIFYVFNTFVTPETVPYTPLRYGLWTLYTFLQGLFGTGLWVIAHECGHQSFSPSKTINDTVGWVLHSALLVPYFSWKISHGKHHKATGNLERDMVFVPRTRDEYASRFGWFAHELTEVMEETPIYTFLYLVVGQQLFGWPMYILTNVTGHDNHEKQIEGKGKGKKNGNFSVNHFIPSSPLYERKDEMLILLSDIGLAITFGTVYLLAQKFGWFNMFVWYIAPYLWVNNWLVAITFLQHTDPTLPHYDAKTWTFARGAAATIDRDFGFIGRHIFHGIIETHVLHHYVSTIPFYNADEATEAIKPVMGRHYRADTEGGALGFIQRLWQSSRRCQWVEPSEGAQGEGKGVMFYRNRNGLGVKPVKMNAPSKKAAGKKVIVGADSDSDS